MLNLNKILILLSTLLIISTHEAKAFFFGWGANSEPSPPTYYYYQKRLLGSQPAYVVSEKDSQPIPVQVQPLPSVPIQVPLQAKISPTNIQNVQLVPCLCPVSQQDFDYDKYSQQQQSSNYLGQLQQQQSQSQQPDVSLYLNGANNNLGQQNQQN